ncbi:2-oxoglutarate dehydrogenase complex dihydrolipoyllysine-residue succinyltransferase [bacterium]|nr:2-oxoglutarate dehydrogenase complex dihydrolipoyllysine-residue succinyltransferase [bacterium]
MAIDIKVPEVGESITEGVIVEWHVADGDTVEAEAPLFELETDKITMTVQAESGGVVKVQVGEDETVQIGQVVGSIDPDGAGSAPAKDDAPADEPAADDEDTGAEESKPEPESEPDSEPEADDESDSAPDDDRLMPAARRMVQQHKLDPSKIEGTGKGGRILKEDVQNFLDSKDAKPKQEAKPEAKKADVPAKSESKPAPKPKQQPKRDPSERQTRTPMTQIRKRIAQRLLEAKNATAMLTTFNEVDMGNLMEMRGRYKESFEKEYGIKLGVMSFFVKAVVDALQRFPEVNRFIDGDDFVENHYYDIGIAVSTDRGLMVPVIRDVDNMSFAEVELAIADYAKRAREGKIGLDDLQGGTFTITNGGVFGSLLSTPILNPPQSAILGMHGIKKRPMVDEQTGEIVVKQMMYLAMSYDHRVIDGRESVTFLKRIMDCIENPERMMFGI